MFTVIPKDGIKYQNDTLNDIESNLTVKKLKRLSLFWKTSTLSLPIASVLYFTHVLHIRRVSSLREMIFSKRQRHPQSNKKTTLLLLAGKGRIPLLTEIQEVFRKSLVTLKKSFGKPLG